MRALYTFEFLHKLWFSRRFLEGDAASEAAALLRSEGDEELGDLKKTPAETEQRWILCYPKE